MGGIVILTGLALLAIFMIWLPFFVMRQAGKSPKLEKHKKTLGLASFLIVFLIFFGDHMYKYARFYYICETQAGEKIYDQEAYDRFRKSVVEENYPRLNKEDIDFLEKKNFAFNEKANVFIFDKKNNYLYWSVWPDKDNYFLIKKIMNLNTDKVIYEFKDYAGSQGGWLCRLFDVSLGTCGFGSCKTNQFGTFRK